MALTRSAGRTIGCRRRSQRYGPELEERLRCHLKPTNKPWRVDETYVRVKGRWFYLSRALDSTGATINFVLSGWRDAGAATRLFRKALTDPSHPPPRVINTTRPAFDLLTAVEGPLVRVTADAAYDTVAVYETARARGATVVIPPVRTATVSGHGPRSPARDRRITLVKQLGRRRWKQASGYHRQGRRHVG